MPAECFFLRLSIAWAVHIEIHFTWLYNSFYQMRFFIECVCIVYYLPKPEPGVDPESAGLLQWCGIVCVFPPCGGGEPRGCGWYSGGI